MGDARPGEDRTQTGQDRPPADPMKIRLVAAVAAGVLLAGCGSGTSTMERATINDRGCITSFDPGTDYFPNKSTLKHAKNFSVRYEKSYQVLTVHEPTPGAEPESYVLVRCGAPDPHLPGALSSAPKVQVPIQTLYSASTTHLPLLVDLGKVGILTGVSNASFVSGKDVLDRINAGTVTEYAPNQQVNVEQVVAAQPDVLITGGTDDPAYGPLRAAGITVLANTEYRESSPLGRAEWIKYMAALTSSERKAAEVFDRIERDYRTIAATAANAGPRTPLALGTMTQGVWYVASGGSYVGRLIADAGGSYPWEDDLKTGSLQLSFETVFAEAGAAPIWLVIQATWKSKADALAADPRYGELTAMKSGQVWSANKVLGPGGGNDYYERGVTRPDLVLADLVAILHPDLLPDHEFSFYQRLADR
ncbi:MAG TPA: ABC transporter substrate-binding protein [Pseudonocardiaceae bacterium]|nr:ABC transporter substrate-binding protein [Pseudonocardiaceae bacterium]